MFGPTRTRATWKPRIGEGDLAFCRDAGGASITLALSGADVGRYADTADRSKMFLPDYLLVPADSPACERAPIAPAAEMPHRLSYEIVGGFEHNAIRVSWPSDARPRWIALKTFTGIQVKYPQPDKRPPVVFALADEDAYCYCDESPCKQCSFNCKSGFVLYAFYEDQGIARTDIERVSID